MNRLAVEEQAKQKVTRARIKILLKNPFFGALVMYLPMQYDDTIARADTDGEVLFYNPWWVNLLSEDEIATAICHTVLHCALGHPWRRGEREPQQWERACDLVVNLILAAEDYQLPPKLQMDQVYQQKSAEEVYNLLTKAAVTGKAKLPLPGGKPAEQPGQQVNSAEGSAEAGQLDQHTRWSGSVEKPSLNEQSLERLWQERVARALQSARGRGDLPGALERAMGKLLHPEKAWRQALAEFLLQVRSDYSWVPPDRRLITYRILVPDLGLVEEQMEDLVIAVDTSGSIEPLVLQRFLSEVQGIIGAFTSLRGHLVFCDSTVQSWSNLWEFQEQLPRGGGGTDTRPVFAELQKRGLRPAALVYCTDGITRYPEFEPEFPVLWVLTKEHANPPWGRKIVLTTI